MKTIRLAFTNYRSPKAIRDGIQLLLNNNFQEFADEMVNRDAFFNWEIDASLNNKVRICCTDKTLENKLAIRLDEILPNYRSLN